ncbi:hypothetical protein DM860_015481 [Cuscuta australis]|uniref:Uncharacterized protein n=1 Tax=Cuscuta australis TaxID=267555 RepID=A0A328EB12_9ASTE|nr:hypothetical protein DM860_015481 [Cuscuta australis]
MADLCKDGSSAYPLLSYSVRSFVVYGGCNPSTETLASFTISSFGIEGGDDLLGQDAGDLLGQDAEEIERGEPSRDTSIKVKILKTPPHTLLSFIVYVFTYPYCRDSNSVTSPSLTGIWPESGKTFIALKLRHVDRIYGDALNATPRPSSGCGCSGMPLGLKLSPRLPPTPTSLAVLAAAELTSATPSSSISLMGV